MIETTLPAEFQVMVARGFPLPLALILCREAKRRFMAPGRFALEGGYVDEPAYFSAVAEAVNLPFLPEGSYKRRSHGRKVEWLTECFEEPLACIGSSSGNQIFTGVPKPEKIELLQQIIAGQPALRLCVRICCVHGPAASAAGLDDPCAYMPRHGSGARERLSAGQKQFFGITITTIFLGWWMPISVYLWLFMGLVAISGCGLSLLRLGAVLYRQNIPSVAVDAISTDDLPKYTVLVPLYQEAKVVPALIKALRNLDYPRDRLQILFLVEGDDIETQKAMSNLPHYMQIAVVPPLGPRTKPRALLHGLGMASGELVTVYDAEDRPDPMQLRKAACRFASSGPKLACLQSQLAVDHTDSRFLVRQFSFEYAVLFEFLLPFLAAYKLVFPLGGTSNHFRRTALERADGWDPYNVTEDADLGIRLKLLGYELAMLDSTTYEEAPIHYRIWYNQRRRWIKGWLQTILVHLRNPIDTYYQLGLANSIVIFLYFCGILLGLSAHPLGFALIFGQSLGYLPSPFEEQTFPLVLVAVIIASGIMGWTATAICVSVSSRRLDVDMRVIDLLVIPFYWLIQSTAFWGAVADLFIRPHHWRKTPHGLALRPMSPSD